MAQKKCMNMEKFRRNFELVPELIPITINDFLQEAPHTMKKIETALAAKDYKSLEISAHSLKGSTSNFFAEACQNAAGLLEKLAREKNLSEAPSALTTLEQEMKQLQSELAALLANEAA